jgi:hypothetical protein
MTLHIAILLGLAQLDKGWIITLGKEIHLANVVLPNVELLNVELPNVKLLNAKLPNAEKLPNVEYCPTSNITQRRILQNVL